MKKIPILLFAIMMAGSLSAQIESFSESDDFVSARSKPAFNKVDFLKPFEGNLSPCGNGVANLIGEQLYCQTQANISSTKFYYVLVKDKEELVLSKIQQGKYYTVKDILITKEEINRLQEEFNNLSFRSDTLYYNNDGQLDKTRLPKKAKQFIIPKEDILSVFYNKYREWPSEYSLRKDQDIKLAIFVLKDDSENEYYVPMEDDYNTSAFEIRTLKQSWPNSISFYPGALAGISNFITVKGFSIVKQLFENKRIVEQSYDYCNPSSVKICKKIAIKNGKVMAAVTDTSSTTVSYLPVVDIRRRALSWCHEADSLIFIRFSGVKYEYCTLADRDSIEAKIAYQKQREEQEKLRKDERKKQELIKKYGAKIGQSIANGKACVGMTKDQCKEAMGTPDNIAKNNSNQGAVEVWTYSMGYQMLSGLVPITVVTFRNNKVISVDEYYNWPY